MAGTTQYGHVLSMADSAERKALAQQPKMVAELETLRAGLAALAASFNLLLTKLDGDAGVSLTDYNSTRAVSAVTYDQAADFTSAAIYDSATSAAVTDP